MTTAQPTDPMPPAANTSPRADALPLVSFLTGAGSSPAPGPMNSRYAIAAVANVAQSHTWRRTYARPVRMSAPTDPGSAGRRGERAAPPRAGRAGRRHEARG